MARRASIRAFTLWAITPGEDTDIHAGLFAGFENGTLRPVVSKEVPLAEAARAHEEILEPDRPASSCSSADLRGRDSNDEIAETITPWPAHISEGGLKQRYVR